MSCNINMSSYFPEQPPQSSMTVQCPHCSTQLTVSSLDAGQTASCSNCAGKFQLPIPTAQVPMDADQLARKAFADKKLAAGLCGILVGSFGVHKFILGYNNAGIVMLCVWLVGMFFGLCLIVPIVLSLAIQMIGFIEGIMYLSKSDEEFYQTYAVERREWF